MELTLNFVWALLAVVIIALWRRQAPQDGASRGAQLPALAMLLLILFPVISVTDDLQAMQIPAESDSSLCREQSISAHQQLFPAIALPSPHFREISFSFLCIAAPRELPAPVVGHPGLKAIQNRPPPAA
jgi:hypothetical protein